MFLIFFCFAHNRTSIEEKQSTNRLADNASNISKSVNVSNETTHLIAQTQNDKQENQPKKIASQPASELRPPSQSTNINCKYSSVMTLIRHIFVYVVPLIKLVVKIEQNFLSEVGKQHTDLYTNKRRKVA